MEIFNVGIPELILILLIMLIVLGPEQSVAQMKNLARFIRKVVRSPLWSDIMNTSREIKELPTKMLRESGIDDEMTEINRQIHSAIPGPVKSPDGHTSQAGDSPEKQNEASQKTNAENSLHPK